MNSASVALGVASRGLHKLLKSPAYASPPILVPLLFFAAFTGALSVISHTKTFHYYSYTAFQFIFVFFESMALIGVFNAFDIARDYESGFGSRMMLAAPRRMAIVVGYVIVSLSRAVLGVAVIWAVALAAGMPVRGSAIDIIGVIALGLLLNTAIALYGAGIALRLQTAAAGVLIMIPVFMALFVSPVMVERPQLGGWLHTVADGNPITALLESGRGFMAGHPVSVAVAFGAAVGLVLFFALFAAMGMHRAEHGDGGGRKSRGG